MERLIIHGDPGVRKDGVIELDGEELAVFQVNRNGDWHGPDRPQLWCVVGDASEKSDFDERNYIPHWLDVEDVDAEDVTVLKKGGELTV